MLFSAKWIWDAVNTTWVRARGSADGAAYMTPVANINNYSGGKLAVSGSSAQTAAISGTLIDVTVDTDEVFIQIGANPTAVADTGYRLFAGAVFRFQITPDDKLAAIIGSGSANLWYHVIGG